MLTGLVRPIGLVALAMAAVVGVAVPLTPTHEADAAGDRYQVSNWTDPDGTKHRIRWNPCQTITYAVNPRLAGKSTAARAAAVTDVKGAFRRMSQRTGIEVAYVGRTDEIPRDGASESWSTKQRAAEIVVAWVDQDRAAKRSNLMGNSGGGYPSGVGGWMMRAWSGSGGTWRTAIGRGFVVINADHNRLYTSGFGSGMTRGALLLHEIGHALGLDHVGSTAQLMYPQMLDRGMSGYHEGDRRGLRKVGEPLGCVSGTAQAWRQI